MARVLFCLLVVLCAVAVCSTEFTKQRTHVIAERSVQERVSLLNLGVGTFISDVFLEIGLFLMNYVPWVGTILGSIIMIGDIVITPPFVWLFG